MPAHAVEWIRELRASHQRQDSLVGRLGPEDLRRPSYDRDWTVTQLLGRMGSNAEITCRRFDVALIGSGSFDRSDARKIWDRWASMEPEAVAGEMVESDRACVRMFESLDERTIRDLRIPAAGTVEDVRDAAAGRLNEHALHSWDTAGTFDSAARIAPGSVHLLLEIPAEALVRLIYGRLDPDHTPTGIQPRPPLETDDLRAVFPGF